MISNIPSLEWAKCMYIYLEKKSKNISPASNHRWESSILFKYSIRKSL